METISGHDQKDGTSLKNEGYDYRISADISGKKVCIVKELFEKADDDTKAKINSFADALRSKGAVVEEVSFDIFDTANTAWQILYTAETCNNVSRYDGVKYGHRAAEYRNIDELYVNTRTEGFNFLTKAVILYGSDVLSKNRYKDCYDKSLRVRRVMAEKYEELLANCDALLTPVCSVSSYKPYDIKDAFTKVYEESVFTSISNLIGAPALVSGGVQLMGKNFDESALLSLAAAVEKGGSK